MVIIALRLISSLNILVIIKDLLALYYFFTPLSLLRSVNIYSEQYLCTIVIAGRIKKLRVSDFLNLRQNYYTICRSQR